MTIKKLPLLLPLTCSIQAIVQLPLRLPAILSDHAVLQQSSEVKLWGWEPGSMNVSIVGPLLPFRIDKWY